MELLQVCLVVSQNLGEGALVQIFCWYAREKWVSYFSLVSCEDCLEVCFVGLLVRRICVWCVVIVVIFKGFRQAGAKRSGGCLKVIYWRWRCKLQKGGSFHIGNAGSHYVYNTAVL